MVKKFNLYLFLNSNTMQSYELKTIKTNFKSFLSQKDTKNKILDSDIYKYHLLLSTQIAKRS